MEATQRPDRAQGRREDWFDDSFVNEWIEEQDGRADERNRQFVMMRALIPKTETEEFRYLNIGAGAGHLDEVLLQRFRGAQAVLVDGSMAMLGAARKKLERF